MNLQLKRMLLGDPLHQVKQKLDEAKLALARRRAEMHFCKEMADDYAARAAEIDPHTDWIAFAEAKEGEKQYMEEWHGHVSLMHAEYAKVTARKSQYESLRKGEV